MKTKRYIAIICAIILIALWVFTGLDKFWDLPGFKKTLERQPLPSWSVQYLYWMLPSLEVLCIFLLAFNTGKGIQNTKWLGFLLSTLLMVAFTLFILFGVLGWYAQRPCGCGSVISHLTWEQHLWFNIVFLLISLLGIWASWTDRDNSDSQGSHKESNRTRFVDPHLFVFIIHVYKGYLLHITKIKRLRCSRRFALFPGEAGMRSKLCTIAIRRKRC